MKKYLTKFNTISDYNTFIEGNTKEYVNVSYIVDDDEVKYFRLPDYSKMYFTFEAVESGTFSLSTANLLYSLDDGTTWTTLAANTQTPTVAAGDKILWKSNGTFSSVVGVFGATGKFNVMGNAESLIYGDNFVGKTDLNSSNYIFYRLFINNTKLIDASNMMLPATTATEACYSYMFKGCTSLTAAPELPATTLALRCYEEMFSGCTSLTTAPVLPTTTLSNYSYRYMFWNCSSLKYVKCLATDISAPVCTDHWLLNVSSTGTFVKNASMTSWTTGIDGIPSGWTVQDA